MSDSEVEQLSSCKRTPKIFSNKKNYSLENSYRYPSELCRLPSDADRRTRTGRRLVLEPETGCVDHLREYYYRNEKQIIGVASGVLGLISLILLISAIVYHIQRFSVDWRQLEQDDPNRLSFHHHVFNETFDERAKQMKQQDAVNEIKENEGKSYIKSPLPIVIIDDWRVVEDQNQYFYGTSPAISKNRRKRQIMKKIKELKDLEKDGETIKCTKDGRHCIKTVNDVSQKFDEFSDFLQKFHFAEANNSVFDDYVFTTPEDDEVGQGKFSDNLYEIDTTTEIDVRNTEQGKINDNEEKFSSTTIRGEEGGQQPTVKPKEEMQSQGSTVRADEDIQISQEPTFQTKDDIQISEEPSVQIKDDIPINEEPTVQTKDDIQISEEPSVQINDDIQINQEPTVQINDETQITQEPTVQTNDQTQINQEPTIQINDDIQINQEPTVQTNDDIQINQEPTFQTKDDIQISEEPSVQIKDDIPINEEPTVQTNDETQISEEPTVQINDDIQINQEPTVQTNDETQISEEPTVQINDDIQINQGPTVQTNDDIQINEEPTIQTNDDIQINRESNVVNTEGSRGTSPAWLQKKDEMIEISDERMAASDDVFVTPNGKLNEVTVESEKNSDDVVESTKSEANEKFSEVPSVEKEDQVSEIPTTISSLTEFTTSENESGEANLIQNALSSFMLNVYQLMKPYSKTTLSTKNPRFRDFEEEFGVEDGQRDDLSDLPEIPSLSNETVEVQSGEHHDVDSFTTEEVSTTGRVAEMGSQQYDPTAGNPVPTPDNSGTTILEKVTSYEYEDNEIGNVPPTGPADDDQNTLTSTSLNSKETRAVHEPIVGLSLDDVRRLMSNPSRIVSGITDVQFPTGPALQKPTHLSAGEVSKTSQQLSIVPSGLSSPASPYQICFYSTQGSQLRNKIRKRYIPKFYQPFDAQTNYAPPQHNFYNFYINNYPSDSLTQNYPPYHPPQPFNTPVSNQPLFCTFLTSFPFNVPTVSGTSEFRNEYPVCTNCKENKVNRYLFEHIEEDISPPAECSDDSYYCADMTHCVKRSLWCDSQVDCEDGSDEKSCSCKTRVNKIRLCDGYFDCPDGEDELGCGECSKNSFSCRDWESGKENCVTVSQRCDGKKDCSNGFDEQDCAILTEDIQNNQSIHLSYSQGFLHRNWKGKWYPVCYEGRHSMWAKDTCERELGYESSFPKMFSKRYGSAPNVHFVSERPDGNLELRDSCRDGSALFVECPPAQCGTRDKSENEQEMDDFIARFKRYIESRSNAVNVPESDKEFVERWNVLKGDIKDKYKVGNVVGKIVPVGTRRVRREDENEEQVRVVGGRESVPGSWPWIVAIYRDGKFFCGGVILSENWVLTAAHCVLRYEDHYYEVQAGMVRRMSFSPTEQTRTVSDVVVHELFDMKNMKNDVALLNLQLPLKFNRWVRPVCLPTLTNGVQDGLWGPKPGTRCTAIGWGAIEEKGPDPDHLREVEVPILPRCVHMEDIEGGEICAGFMEGGKDTCQGDSGGPLLCKESKRADKWFVAGVVSHGKGCARPEEPGAYTRISFYLNWISEHSNETHRPAKKPLHTCPGFKCSSQPGRCLPANYRCDGVINCLGGEDEDNCEEYLSYVDLLQQQLKIVDAEERSVSEEKPIYSYTEKQVNQSKYFECQHLIQSVPYERKCDRIKDCEDGSDEENCTCSDVLVNHDKQMICNGVFDCKDLSDESECFQCPAESFQCSKSKECLKMNKRCDGTPDCASGEDEQNCVVLREMFASKESDVEQSSLDGLINTNRNGVWKLYCELEDSNSSVFAHEICYNFKSNGFLLFQQHNLTDEDCVVVRVVCGDPTQEIQMYKTGEDEYYWPWYTFLYLDGDYVCSGVLLDKDRVLVPASCVSNFTGSKQYLQAELGSRLKKVDVQEYRSESRRAVSAYNIPETQLAFVYLNASLQETKEIRFISLISTTQMSDLTKTSCIAVGKSADGGVRTVQLTVSRDCNNGTSEFCFMRKNQGSCESETKWSGVISCQSEFSWYPACHFDLENGECGLESLPWNVSLVDVVLQNSMSNSHDKHDLQTNEPVCNGERTRLGKCVRKFNECEDTKLKCNNGLCIPNTRFGDNVDDCGDMSDEPVNKTCANYLRMTSPSKICDGTRNCYDKSDESPSLCPCIPSSFTCSKSGLCIPMEFVCDGEEDCPDAEDENVCYRVRSIGKDKKKGEVMVRSNGQWYTYCTEDTSLENTSKFCYDFGCTNCLIQRDVKQSFEPKIEPFSNLKLNKNTTIVIRPDRHFITKFETVQNCHSVYITCM